MYFYNARWYDSSLGRFNQPDTIIPGPGNSEAWDRYSYVNNNPLRYNDPTGHRPCGDDEIINCEGRLNNPKPIQHGGCNNASRQDNCLGNTTPRKGEAGAGFIDLLFDPYYGPFIQDLQDNSLTMEQLENVNSVWISADLAYDAYGIDLKEIAASGATNPLTADQIYEFLTAGATVEGLLMDRSAHKPYLLFLQKLGEKLDKNLLADPMQFEPNYIEALMVAHPDSLAAAKDAYREDFVQEVLQDNASDILQEFLEKLRRSGGSTPQ